MSADQKQLPPESMSASELWAALSEMPRPSRVVDFPRKDPITGKPVGQMAIQVLTQEEQISAAASAEKIAQTLLKDDAKNKGLGYEAVYENEATIQVLHRACRDVRDLSIPAFPSVILMRQKLTVDEVSVLANLYFQVQWETGPIVSQMSAEEEAAWIKRLAEGGTVFPTASLSHRERERLLTSMAVQLVSFWMGTSSAGSPPAPKSDGPTADVSGDLIPPPPEEPA